MEIQQLPDQFPIALVAKLEFLYPKVVEIECRSDLIFFQFI